MTAALLPSLSSTTTPETAARKIASAPQNGAVTHHQDQLILSHSFSPTNMTPRSHAKNMGIGKLKVTLLLLTQSPFA
jgi:hypothetical protein